MSIKIAMIRTSFLKAMSKSTNSNKMEIFQAFIKGKFIRTFSPISMIVSLSIAMAATSLELEIDKESTPIKAPILSTKASGSTNDLMERGLSNSN